MCQSAKNTVKSTNPTGTLESRFHARRTQVGPSIHCHSQAGTPSSTSGANTWESSRCCTMWALNR